MQRGSMETLAVYYFRQRVSGCPLYPRILASRHQQLLELHKVLFQPSESQRYVLFLNSFPFFSSYSNIPIELYTVEDTCYYHEGMEYCPVLLRIAPVVKKHIYNNTEYKYLLQVWNSQSEKVFEEKLESKSNMMLRSYRSH